MWSEVSVAVEAGCVCVCDRERERRGEREEKDLHGDLPGVLTLRRMIARGCTATQACNLLVATI